MEELAAGEEDESLDVDQAVELELAVQVQVSYSARASWPQLLLGSSSSLLEQQTHFGFPAADALAQPGPGHAVWA